MDDGGVIMKASRWARLALVGFYIGIAMFVAGFWFHTSDDPRIFAKYSGPYFLGVIGITVLGIGTAYVAWLILTPQAIHLSSGRDWIVPLQTKLLVLVVFSFLGLLLIETKLVRWERQRLGPRRNIAGYHPYLQNVPVPGDTVQHINRWGFRGEDIEQVKPPNTYRIFALGGSTVYCGQVDFEHTFCRVLEKRLRQAYPQVRIEVQNAGVDSHTLQHSIFRLLFTVQDFHPDLIISLQGFNDLLRSYTPPYVSIGPFQPDYGHYLGTTARMYHEYAQAESRFTFITVQQVADLLDTKWFSDFRHPYEPARGVVEIPYADWKSLPCFARNYRDLITIVRAKRIDLVMASQASLYHEQATGEEWARIQKSRAESFHRGLILNDKMEAPDLASFCRGLELFNETSRTIAREQGVVFVDLDKHLPKQVQYFTDDVHYTELGNQVVADAFAEAILANRFVDRKFLRQ